MTEKVPRMKLPPVEQIGMVVEDIERAIEYYSSVFGWGPFRVHEVEVKGFMYRGKAGDARMKLAFAKSGPIEIELIQVLEGETPHTEFLRERGEGVQHLRFSVDDVKGALAELAKEGIEPVFYQFLPEYGTAFAYIDSDQVGGVMFELFQRASVEGVKRTPTGRR